MLYGEAIKEFDELEIHNSGTENDHLKHITEVLLRYFILINVISNQKHAICRAMCKPRIISFMHFEAQIT